MLLEIKKQTITLGNSIYQISNITEIGKYKKVSTVAPILMIACVLGVVFGIVALTQGRGDDQLIGLILAVVSFILFFIFRHFNKPLFILRMVTSSGSSNLLASKDESFIDELVSIFSDAIDKRIRSATYNINAEKAKIVNKSVHVEEAVMGDKYSDIHNSTIINRSTLNNALNSVEAKFGKETADALNLISTHLENNPSEIGKDLFNSFNAEFAREKPNKNILRTLWDGFLEHLPDTAKITAAIATISKAVTS